MNRSMIILASILLLQSVICNFWGASGQFTPIDNVLLAGEPAIVGSLPTNFSGGYGVFNDVLIGNMTNLQLVAKYNEYESGPGPVCYLEVITGNNSREFVNRTHYWTKPCPAEPLRVPAQGFWCRFEFAADGNVVLKSGTTNVPAENGTVLWSSNTSGSGATTLSLVDVGDAAFGPGNLVLYNGVNEVVWSAFGNTSDYGCTYLQYTPPPTVPAAGRKLLLHH